MMNVAIVHYCSRPKCNFFVCVSLCNALHYSVEVSGETFYFIQRKHRQNRPDVYIAQSCSILREICCDKFKGGITNCPIENRNRCPRGGSKAWKKCNNLATFGFSSSFVNFWQPNVVKQPDEHRKWGGNWITRTQWVLPFATVVTLFERSQHPGHDLEFVNQIWSFSKIVVLGYSRHIRHFWRTGLVNEISRPGKKTSDIVRRTTVDVTHLRNHNGPVAHELQFIYDLSVWITRQVYIITNGSLGSQYANKSGW